MPITYSIDSARRRLFAVAEGSVTYGEIMAHLGKERDDEGLPLPELIEAREATVVLTAAEVRQVVERLRALGGESALGPTAVVTDDDVSYGIMRMLEVLVEDVCDIRPFRDRDEAEEWLNATRMPRPPTQER
jgi:hypothetical protein